MLLPVDALTLRACAQSVRRESTSPRPTHPALCARSARRTPRPRGPVQPSSRIACARRATLDASPLPLTPVKWPVSAATETASTSASTAVGASQTSSFRSSVAGVTVRARAFEERRAASRSSNAAMNEHASSDASTASAEHPTSERQGRGATVFRASAARPAKRRCRHGVTHRVHLWPSAPVGRLRASS